ncbi:MAG: lipopolysaccharide biosynthesis protein, partial [Syntrophales bacterium]
MRGGKKIIGEQKNRPAVALKNILRHSLIYSAGNFFNKTVAFLLVPFYTHYLVPAEYGTLSLIEITSYIIEMFLAAGISQSIMRFYHEQESVAEKKLLVSSSLITSAAFSFFGLIPFMFLTDFMSAVIFESTRYSVLLKIMLATLFFSMTSEVSLTYLRIKEKSLEYNVAVILRTLLSLTLNIVFVAVFRWGVSGILISSLISIALNGIVLNWLTTREIGFGFSLPHVFEMLKYGLPYIPSGLGMFVINFSDRYFLQRLSSLEELGVYSLGFKFGMIFQFLIFEPFMLIWGPKRFEVARQDNGSRVITRVFTYFCFIQIFAGLSLCLVIKDVMSLVASPAYQQAYRIVPWIVLSYFLLSIYFHIQIGILLKKKTKIIALIIGAAVGIKILLSIILIP